MSVEAKSDNVRLDLWYNYEQSFKERTLFSSDQFWWDGWQIPLYRWWKGRNARRHRNPSLCHKICPRL